MREAAVMMIVQQHVHSQQPHERGVSCMYCMRHHRHRHTSSRSRSKAAPDCYIISMPLGDALGVCVCVAASRLAPVSRSNEGTRSFFARKFPLQHSNSRCTTMFWQLFPRNLRGGQSNLLRRRRAADGVGLRLMSGAEAALPGSGILPYILKGACSLT